MLAVWLGYLHLTPSHEQRSEPYQPYSSVVFGGLQVEHHSVCGFSAYDQGVTHLLLVIAVVILIFNLATGSRRVV
jgi:hypothetical protein